MTPEEQRKIDKENQKLAEEIVAGFAWYSTYKYPNKAAVLVEDLIPVIKKYISKETENN